MLSLKNKPAKMFVAMWYSRVILFPSTMIRQHQANYSRVRRLGRSQRIRDGALDVGTDGEELTVASENARRRSTLAPPLTDGKARQ